MPALGKKLNHEPWALAIETSSEFGSVAVGRGSVLVDQAQFEGMRSHAAELLPSIARLCTSNSIPPSAIETIYVSIGPGSFTGLRIGVTAARMIAFAAGAKVVPVPTLHVIALNALLMDSPPAHVMVLLDAKRARVYAQSFANRSTTYEPVGEVTEAEPTQLLAVQPPWCAVMGTGVCRHRQAIDGSGLRVLPAHLFRPQIEKVWELGSLFALRGQFTDPRTLVPLYIRPPEAEEKWAAARAMNH